MKTRLALLLAILADGLQLLLTPLIPAAGLGVFLDGAIDIAAACALVVLLGPHWAFLPSFIAEIIPGVGLVPLWTLAVLFVTRKNPTAPRDEKNVRPVLDAVRDKRLVALDEKGRPRH